MQWHAFRGSGVSIALSPGTDAPCGPCQPSLATGTLPGKAGQETGFDCCCKPQHGAVPPGSGALLPEEVGTWLAEGLGARSQARIKAPCLGQARRCSA